MHELKLIFCFTFSCVSFVSFSQCGGGHRPKGGIFPSGRERHVHPNGPAGHRTEQIDPCAAAFQGNTCYKPALSFLKSVDFLFPVLEGVVSRVKYNNLVFT